MSDADYLVTPHGIWPWITVASPKPDPQHPAAALAQHGYMECRACEGRMDLPPRHRPELAEAAINGFIARHQDCERRLSHLPAMRL